MTRRPTMILAAALALLVAAAARAATATLDVDLAHPGPAIPPTFAGLMTEEINHAYDGGLFAELVQNRTFQDDAHRPAHWSVAGDGARMSMDYADPVNGALPVSLRLDLTAGRGTVANDGYWGIPVRPTTAYTATFFAKGTHGFAGPITASMVTDDGNVTVAHADTAPITGDWQRYTVTLTTAADAPTTARAKFALAAAGPGTVAFSLVSLFPPTYGDVPNGLRPDLMKLMADLHPAFIRLPGGNYLEGDTFATRFNWKQMIGPADHRPGHMGCWGYRSSDGFGLPQYLLWCRQLHAEPILALFAGYTLNHDHVTAGPDLQPFVDDALAEIEYVAGPPDSEWGRRRATDGLPEPFHLTYVEVGNEDWFDASGSYDGRFAQFYDAIHARYPGLKIIATAPVKARRPDVVDDHFYRSPRQMAGDWAHYHGADANAATGFGEGHAKSYVKGGPKIFCGEWASQEGRPTPDLDAALGDAAWLMGLERDADVVPIECYAPLLVNVNPGAWQWPTNLIGYDALRSFGSPSYYAQAMLAQNRGDAVLPAKLTVDAPATAATTAPRGAIGVGTWHTRVQYRDLTVTSPDGKPLFSAADASTADATAAKGWTFTGDRWSVDGPVIAPAVADAECWAVAGDPAWTDYTLHLRARKTGGREGFLILYHAVDGNDYRWWNVGGWGDTATQLERTGPGEQRDRFGPKSDFHVEPDHWYDLRVEVRGRHVRCFADGQLVTDAVEPPSPPPTGPMVYATATSANAGRDVIVKVVNMGAAPVEATLNLTGAAAVAPTGRAIVLAGDPRAVNTVDEPMHVAPQETVVTEAAASFRRTFPPHSLTLLRLTVTPK